MTRNRESQITTYQRVINCDCENIVNKCTGTRCYSGWIRTQDACDLKNLLLECVTHNLVNQY